MSSRSFVSAGTSGAADTNATNRPSPLTDTHGAREGCTSDRCNGTVTTTADSCAGWSMETTKLSAASPRQGATRSAPGDRTCHLSSDALAHRDGAIRFKVTGSGIRVNTGARAVGQTREVDAIQLFDDV